METLKRMRPRFFAALALVLLSGCATTKSYTLHHTLEERPETAPRKVLVLPVSVTMYEVSAGGLAEEVPAWTEQAQANVAKAVRDILGGQSDLQLIDMPTLTPAQQAAVKEHLALYDQVAATASTLKSFGGPAWAHKRERFDYALGDGLRFLRKATGADAALVVVGQDVATSTGRKAAIFIGALLGVGISGGYSYVSSGLVDLETGNLLWSNQAFKAAGDLRVPADSHAVTVDALKDLPSRDSEVIRQAGR